MHIDFAIPQVVSRHLRIDLAERSDEALIEAIADGDKITETRIPTETGDYRRYYENVRDAIVSGTPLDVSPQHALRIMQALELGIESSKRGCRLPFKDAFAAKT